MPQRHHSLSAESDRYPVEASCGAGENLSTLLVGQIVQAGDHKVVERAEIACETFDGEVGPDHAPLRAEKVEIRSQHHARPVRRGELPSQENAESLTLAWGSCAKVVTPARQVCRPASLAGRAGAGARALLARRARWRRSRRPAGADRAKPVDRRRGRTPPALDSPPAKWDR